VIDYLIALATVTLAWWLSTGIVLLLNHRSAQTQRAAMLLLTAAAATALLALPGSSHDLSAGGALIGFLSGLCIWAWLEMSYLMGFITGPRDEPCPAGATARQRFWLGLQTSLYHEALVLGAMVSTTALTWSGGNRVAAATCVTLGLMRWSAKLNLFLGVRNYNQDWLPRHLSYLDSYTRRARMNPLFPLSVLAGSAMAVHLLLSALVAENAFLRASDLLISALLSLAVLEHWFLVLPFHESALWRWARPEGGAERAATVVTPLRPLAAEKSI
jgi:putative photosynthetic complex assembly protein 2